ncbi:acetyl-CoA carboxylase biotin carboxyl carrier protein subunit [Chloroflexota bacterium]
MGWTMGADEPIKNEMKYIATINGNDYQIEILDDRHISIEGEVREIDFMSVADQPVFSLLMNGKSFEAYVYPEEDKIQVLLQGYSYSVNVEDEREKRLRAAGGSSVSESSEFILKSPMPGLVVSLPVSEGQKVNKGDVLLILESMKMQNELKSPREGVLSRVKVKPGDNVEQRQILLSVV